MDPTTQRPDDELAQQAPLVPDLSRRDGDRPPTRRVSVTDAATRRTNDDELAQAAPLVPDLGRPERASPADAEAPN
ncbi:hypothetical protein [Haloplanus pelagicus]|jgi:hypothetical protein|uniref:hypothetical protein n=1 Tax=Haloplanus pelagicus TaxID=2949995 RepID=UPI00203EBB89|nr:hypothetical protein [Haloplanus sp. HW8-1]